MDKEQITKELNYRFSRSSGSGGQHVNKVETRVELLFDINQSQGLSVREMNRIWQVLDNRINKEGILIIASQAKRSQVLNKKEATERFFKLLDKALRPRPRRKGATAFKANKRKRLQKKKHQSEKKALRKKVKPPRDYY
ncbi:MAG TPA: alternative ribosome rescue aminoacyl-tRNA hydrolase ArfB [Saprospiraceae bacterium]|nr:alternative ribosome rescue aminoacyl-tRNA hydrolase ArfB [Saprospiraceae bacterium]